MTTTNTNIPLAERMRPASLNEYIGQEQILGKDKVLRKVIENGLIPSLIFWGPPGVGKTTLAQLIANEVQAPFYTLSAINSGVKDVREAINKASKRDMFSTNKKPILFIDEIHRFSKSQQDSLLGAVEKGIISLIGATTENPSFEVIPALLSRCQVYTLKAFGKKELLQILNRALNTDPWLKSKKINLKETDKLLLYSGGDARKLLNLLEIIVNQSTNNTEIIIDNQTVIEILKNNITAYDKQGEMHYDIISAYIKSIRGSDPNAAVYWLARMIEGGEDPKFIARRLLILASEDIGNANPTALVIANNCFNAVSVIGWPESRIILSQTTIYLATSPKSNAAYEAINKAQEIVKQTGNLPVPLHLRNAPTKLMKELDYGKDYKYAHSFENNFTEQEFLPKEIAGTTIYTPQNNKKEQEIRARLAYWWKNKYGYNR